MPELPDRVVDTAKAMTRAGRRGTHAEPEALRRRRDALLDQYGYAARVREDESGPVLVCYPEDWIEDGLFQPEAVDSTDDAVEAPLWTARTDEDWAAIDAHNRALADAVAGRHGQVHGANAVAFGTYMANHHATRVEDATAEQVREFLDEYFPRNAWASADQAAAIERSLERLYETAGEPYPGQRNRS